MPSFTQLFTLAALATVGFVAATPLASHAHCSGAKLVHNATIDVGGHLVHFTSHSCAAKKVQRRDLWTSPPLCILFNTCAPKTPPPPTPPKNVCGASCTTTCNSLAGILPPISEDCDTIEDAIQILNGAPGQASSFVVDPSHLETLTFGTCSYFFQNTGSKQLEYCWTDLSTTGSAAGSACFPPIQPINSEGLCAAYDGTWAVGAAHS